MSYEEWQERVLAEVGERGLEKLSTRLREGFRVEPLYTGDHPPEAPGTEPDVSGFPGSRPFTRGGTATRRGGAGWRVCPEYHSEDLDSLRRALTADVAGGADACRLSLDGDFGSSLRAEELATLLEIPPADGFELVVDAGADALPAAALVLVSLERAGVEPSAWGLFFQADPLGTLARTGRLPRSVAELESEQATLVRYSRATLPRGRAVGIDIASYQEAGAHTVQELAFGLATGLHYLRSLERLGVEAIEAAGEISFVTAVGGDLFLEIAKLRALRLLWSRVLSVCDAKEAPPPRVHAVASRRSLTRIDPWNNMLRVTLAAFAAAAGGADAVTTIPFDVPLGSSDDASRRLARNTQLILAEESHLSRVLDPAGGSYYVEWLTDRLAREAWELMREVERRGGMLECLLTGWPQSQIESSAQDLAESIATRTAPITRASPTSTGPPAPDPLTHLRHLATTGATLDALSRTLPATDPLPTASPLALRRGAELREPSP